MDPWPLAMAKATAMAMAMTMAMDPWTASVSNMMQTHEISIGKVSSCQLMRFQSARSAVANSRSSHKEWAQRGYNLKRKGAAEQIPCDLILWGPWGLYGGSRSGTFRRQQLQHIILLRKQQQLVI